MKKRKIEKSLNTAIAEITPDVFEKVSSAPLKNELQEENFMQTDSKKIIPFFKKRALTAIAACAAVMVAFGSIFYVGNALPDASIAIDVNPSVEIILNKADRVLEVKALNPDAEKIIAGMDLKNTDYNVAVNAVMGSMLKNGYFDTAKDTAILLTVQSNNKQKAEAIKASVSSDIENTIGNNAKIFGQNVSESNEIKALSEKYGVSYSKAYFCVEIMKKDPTLKAENILKMPISEIMLLAAGKNMDLKDVVSYDDNAYSPIPQNKITSDEAIRLAKTLASGDVIKCELSFDDGSWVYDVEISDGKTDYDFEFDAVSGKLLSSEQETAKSEKPSKNRNDNAAVKKLSSDEAIKIARRKASGKLTKCELSYDDGRFLYEMEFEDGLKEYDVEIDAVSGEFIKFEIESKDDKKVSDPKKNESVQSPAKENLISKEKALEIARTKASGTLVNCELDKDNGKYIYEIEYLDGTTEYDLKIDAITGAILNFETDTNEELDVVTGASKKVDTNTNNQKNLQASVKAQNTQSPAKENLISKEKALEIARTKASGTLVNCELDKDNGKYTYEVEYKDGTTEYDLTIDAVTGVILTFETDTDD